MAVTNDQITLIQDALRSLGMTPGGEARLAQDVAAGMERLVALVNDGKPDSQKLEYDPAVGYTPELGEGLLKEIEALKAGDTFEALQTAYETPLVGERLTQALLRNKDNIPFAMKKDPAKLFDVLEKAPQIVAGLDAAHVDGKLVLSAPAQPAPAAQQTTTPATPVTPPAAPGSDPSSAASVPAQEPEVEFEPEEEEIPRTLVGETYIVELALKKLAPLLNEKLEEASNKTDAQFEEMPAFIRDLVAAFRDVATGGLLEQRVVEIGEPDGVFSRHDQAALQGLLSVLGNDKLIGEIDPVYRPSSGLRIKAGLPKLKETLKAYMSEEEFKQFDETLTDENVAQLVDALDFLHAEGKIWRGLLVDPKGNEIHAIPAHTEDIFQQRVDEFQETNPDMLRLLDAMTYEYTAVEDLNSPDGIAGWGMNDIMALDLDDISLLDTDIADRQEAIKTFYNSALEKHRANGGTDQQFQADIALLINTVITLPYGEEAYRRGLQQSWIDAAASGDADAFADGVIKSAAQLREEYGDPNYQYYYQRDVAVWKPGLENMTFTSGGQAFSALDIANAYDNKHLVQAPQDFRERGVSDVVENHGYYAFRDDQGDLYVAAIDKQSMVFSIEKIDLEKVKSIYFNEDKTREEVIQEMRETDPGMALLSQDNDVLLAWSYENLFADLEKVPPATQTAGWYKAEADKIRADVKVKLDVEAQKNPTPYSTGPRTETSAGPVQRDPSYVPSGERKSVVEITRELQPLQDYAASRFTVPEILRPDDRAADLETLNMLEKFDGQELRIGATYGEKFQVTGVEVGGRNCGQPLMVWYDRRTTSVKAQAAPEYLTDPEKLQGLKNDLSSVDSAESFIHIKEKYPEFFEMVVGYRETRPLQENFAPTMDEYWGFNENARMLLENVENSMKGAADPAPKKPGWISRQVNKVFGESEQQEPVSATSCFNNEAQMEEVEIPKPEGVVEASNAIGSDMPVDDDVLEELKLAPDMAPDHNM